MRIALAIVVVALFAQAASDALVDVPRSTIRFPYSMLGILLPQTNGYLFGRNLQFVLLNRSLQRVPRNVQSALVGSALLITRFPSS
jgi:hypothetical protein